MNETDKIVNEFMLDLVSLSQDTFEYMRIIYRSIFSDDIKIMNFFELAFKIAEQHRPLLIEEKEGAA
ncbi:MAG: hypothetical protein PHR92_18115 [Lachnospiraceae bacterium]|nr:hypothetical protein [Lachnospiraceae bacterium]